MKLKASFPFFYVKKKKKKLVPKCLSNRCVEKKTPNFFLFSLGEICFTEHKFLEDTDMEPLSIFYCCQMTCPPISLLTPKLYYSILSLPLSHHPFPPNFPIRPCFLTAKLDAQSPSVSPVSAPLLPLCLISHLYTCVFVLHFCSPPSVPPVVCESASFSPSHFRLISMFLSAMAVL